MISDTTSPWVRMALGEEPFLKQAGWDDLEGTEVDITRLIFSPAEGKKKGIRLIETVKSASRIFEDILARLPKV